MEQLSKADIQKEQRVIIAAALDSMQKQMFLTDVMITCMGQELAAHRVILSAGSPYFRAMFSNNMLEANSGKVEFEHISLDSMQVILQFLYTGHIADIESDVEKVKGILSASHLLQVNLMYEYCWNFFRDTLSVDQCFELWMLAELYQHTEMAETIIKYMVEHFSLVMASNDFLALPVYKLEILLKHPSLNTSPELLVKKLIEWSQQIRKNESKVDLMHLMEYVDFNSLSNEFISAATEDDFIKTSSALLCKLLTVAMSRTARISQVEVSSVNSHSDVNILYIFVEPNLLYTFNFKTGNWQTQKHLQFKLECGMTSVFDGDIAYFIGGGNFPKNASKNVLEYNLETSLCRTSTPCKHNRFCPGATKLGQKIYVIGGKNRKYEPLRDVEVYNLADNVWTSVESTNNAYFCPNVVTINGIIFVVGGCGSSTVEMYSEFSNKWSCMNMTVALSWPLRVARFKQFIWAVDCVQGKAHIYDVEKKFWHSMRITGTEQIIEICSAIETADQGPFIIALDLTGVFYEVDPNTARAVSLVKNAELRRSPLARWLHLHKHFSW